MLNKKPKKKNLEKNKQKAAPVVTVDAIWDEDAFQKAIAAGFDVEDAQAVGRGKLKI